VLLERLALDAQSEETSEIVRLRLPLERKLARFRPTWHRQRVSRGFIQGELRRNSDLGERERAWRAEDSLYRSLEEDARGLFAARNERARELGFPNFAELRLKLMGIPPARLARMLDRLDRAAVRPLRSLREEFLDSQRPVAWMPWDLEHAEHLRTRFPRGAFRPEERIAAVRAAVRGWGFTLHRLRIRIDLHDVPFGGLTQVVRIPDDIRIVMHPEGGWDAYQIAFHEFGHVLHFSHVRQPSHVLRFPDVGFTALVEGVAGFFEEIPLAREWLFTRPGITEANGRAMRAGRGCGLLLQAMSTVGRVRVELALYRDPTHDPLLPAMRRARRLFGFDPFRPRSFLFSTYLTHPLHLSALLFAYCFRKQLVEALAREIGGPIWPNRRVHSWLVPRWLSQGARYDLDERMMALTGHRVGPSALVAALERGEP
jgi:hypothetical protein